jgi:hypothetical protein
MKVLQFFLHYELQDLETPLATPYSLDGDRRTDVGETTVSTMS